DCHEEAFHVRVGHGQRTAACKLTLEQGDERSARPEHVAEADRHESRPVRTPEPFQIEGLAVEFGQPLGRPHYAGGVHHLVGGNLHHAECPAGYDRLGDIHGADDIGKHTLAGIELHHRHMLERGGVKDELGPPLAEDLVKARRVTDVTEVREPGHDRMLFRQIEVDRVEIELAIVDQNQLCGIQRGDLPGQFTSYGTAGTRHQHTPTGEKAAEYGHVQDHLRTFQQVR